MGQPRSKVLGPAIPVMVKDSTSLHPVRGSRRRNEPGRNFTIFKKTTPCKRVALQLSSSTQQTKTWLLSVNELDRFQAGDSDIFQIIDRIGIDRTRIWFTMLKSDKTG